MPPIDLDRLLADTAFVRRIARSLVRDPDAAEDLAQDALVVALERPPREGTSLRGWITTVVRSLAIDRARASNARARREAAVADPEPAPGPEEVAARLDLSQRVASALRELEEPYRTALYLRYVEELDPPAIAERLRLPLATVKTQLRRGLDMLRRRFDREWGGREAWSAALAPWIADPAPVAPIVETLLVSTTTKFVAALLVCGAAAWVLWSEAPTASLADGPAIVDVSGAGLAAPGDEVERRANADVRDDLASAVTEPDPSASRSGPFVRVLDERRFPVVGARVRLHAAGFGDDEATSNARGVARFVGLSGLETEKRGVGVLAWDDRGRAGARLGSVKVVDAATTDADAEVRRDLGEIVLGAGGALTVIVEEDGRAAPGAAVSVEVGARRIAVLDAVADATGRVRFDHLPAKAILVRATRTDRAGRAATILGAGRDDEIAIALEPARTIEVLVVDKETKAPIADARIALSESFQVTDDDGEFVGMAGQTFGTSVPLQLDVAPTDAQGRTRIVGLPAQGKYEVEASADLYVGMQPPARRALVLTDSDALTIELDSLHERVARWPLEAGEVEAPPSGTELTLRKETVDRHGFERSSPPPARARIEGGAIVAEGVRDRIYGCYAIAPDGSLARLWIEDGQEVGAATSFRRPRRIDGKVLDADGNPARGIAVEVRNEGNNWLLPEGATDENGEFVFAGLWGRRARVFARGVEIGTVDLELGDGRVEGRLGASRELDVHLRVDGVPRLPPSYSIRIGRSMRVVSEDPATGVVRVRFDDRGDATTLGVSAPGFLGASVESISSSAQVVEVGLRSGAALLAHVTPPRSGRVRVRCEAWDVEKKRWKTGSAHQVDDERFAPNAPDGGYLFRGLEPGRYRVRDVDAEVSSEAVEVVGSGAPAEVVLDLSSIVRIRGVIDVPPGSDGRLARVVLEGEGVAAHETSWLRGTETPEGRYVDENGRFQVTVDTSRPVTLRAVHPYLWPDAKLGAVVVRGDEPEVRLKLVEGDEVRIGLATFAEPWPRESLRVYAYAGDPVGEPHAWFHAIVVDGVARFSGLERGTWTLWIDPERTSAPTVLRDVVVGAGITRVDAVPAAGSSLRVRVLHVAGNATPRIYVSAHQKAEPTLLRSINSNGEDVVVLPGIGAGTCTVHVSVIGNPATEHTIEFDGRTDVDIEFDARGPKRP